MRIQNGAPFFTVARDFETATEHDWRVATIREAVLAPFASKADRSEADIKQAAKALKRTIVRWDNEWWPRSSFAR